MYNQKHQETEIIETLKFLLPQHPELKYEINNTSIDLNKYFPKEKLVFSKATNLYDIPDDNVIIMRYMDYDKFKYLIEKSSLYMPIPKRFSQDPNEGYLIPDAGKFIDDVLEKMYDEFYEEIISKRISISGMNFTGIKEIDRKKMKNRCFKIYQHNIKRFFISCWTERNIDQDNMWNAYIAEDKRKKAVAIKTTVGKIKKALANNSGLFAITRVKYVDLDSYKISTTDYLNGGMYSLACQMLSLKNKTFEADKEIRIICDNLMTNRTEWYKQSIFTILGNENFDYAAEPEFEVLNAQIILNDFIDEIIVSPHSDNNFIEELKEFLSCHNIEKVLITKSTIREKRKCCWDE